jgi:hypothetical protein
MTQQQKDELNKELCGLLGICWHEFNSKDSKRALARSRIFGGSGRECKKCGIGIESEKRKDNPDFTSEVGRVQLLKLMADRDDYDDFIGFINRWHWIDTEEAFYFMLDDNGAFARAARDFLKAMEGK